MLGNLGNVGSLLKAAKDMQGKIAEVQRMQAARRCESAAGGGMVRAIVDGRGTLVDLKIEPQAVADLELLEDLVKAAVAAAMTKAQEAARADMADLTGGINIPGLTDMLNPPGST